MNIIISNSAGTPIYEQIASQIKAMIMQGTLKEGDALPSMRTLAQDLRVSVITTKRAYEILETEGMIESFTGRGSFVSAQDPMLMREQNLREIELHLSKAADIAKRSGITQAEVAEILSLMFEE
ncbi:MAG: GntR family transcriptional regulator [Oscillospiraceae bacterium]|nr:GntR family transcriptional regulator [Oscillospiraceae bacterium]